MLIDKKYTDADDKVSKEEFILIAEAENRAKEYRERVPYAIQLRDSIIGLTRRYKRLKEKGAPVMALIDAQELLWRKKRQRKEYLINTLRKMLFY